MFILLSKQYGKHSFAPICPVNGEHVLKSLVGLLIEKYGKIFPPKFLLYNQSKYISHERGSTKLLTIDTLFKGQYKQILEIEPL